MTTTRTFRQRVGYARRALGYGLMAHTLRPLIAVAYRLAGEITTPMAGLGDALGRLSPDEFGDLRSEASEFTERWADADQADAEAHYEFMLDEPRRGYFR